MNRGVYDCVVVLKALPGTISSGFVFQRHCCSFLQPGPYVGTHIWHKHIFLNPTRVRFKKMCFSEQV
ncbi:unnamed protein product [Chondrus crispus]|uniref:Uncharacterized protein n=1 Tax=Chondrus crispus TaxID=2769 RepID=R7QFC8_CHOCR|nr:unnamed protein product [Chondrus crispus]CDF37232.1 unnamed protein product [Chondrus crispus]|eukprot:XP_005717051.1 unnamed protein product [Chondrus crispus]